MLLADLASFAEKGVGRGGTFTWLQGTCTVALQNIVYYLRLKRGSPTHTSSKSRWAGRLLIHVHVHVPPLVYQILACWTPDGKARSQPCM